MPTRASRRVHAPLHEPTAAVKSMIIANFSFRFRDNYFSSGRVVGNSYLGITSGLPVIRPESAINSKRAILLPKRLTCCFPKGSVPPFLLETKMAVL